MKILSLGLDNSILNKTSALTRRVVEYGALAEKYTVVVPSKKNEKIELSEKINPVRNFGGELNYAVERRSVISNGVMAYGSGGDNKFSQFIKIYYLVNKLLREEKYDVITVQDQYYLALIGLCLSKKFKVGLEIQVHGFEKYGGLRKLVAKYVLSRAGVVRAVSQRLKKRLIDEFGVKEEKITVVPIYVDTTSTLSLRDRIGGRSNLTYSEVNQRLPRRPEYGATRNDIDAFVFLTVGRLVPVKNIGLQIKAMAEVIKKYPNTELWIAGDGPLSAELKEESKKLKIDIKIKFLGWQADLKEYYGQADVFMLTSDAEGWPLVIVEAANYSLPIIMTDMGSAGELIINNESGLVIPIGDKEKLTETMLKIIEDENLKKKLGANAKLAVSHLPSKENIFELYKLSWQKALAGIK